MATPSMFPADRPFVSSETFNAFFAVMDRLDVVLNMETRAMGRHDHSGLVESARQKRQGLLELDRIMRTIHGAIPSTDIMKRLATFRDRLATNQAALQVELTAAKAVTGTIVRVMRDLEHDGTYSRSYARQDAHAFGYDEL